MLPPRTLKEGHHEYGSHCTSLVLEIVKYHQIIGVKPIGRMRHYNQKAQSYDVGSWRFIRLGLEPNAVSLITGVVHGIARTSSRAVFTPGMRLWLLSACVNGNATQYMD